jgi:hypothetical protein
VLPPSSLVLTQPVRGRDELATFRPNRRPVLIVGGHLSASGGVGVLQGRM